MHCRTLISSTTSSIIGGLRNLASGKRQNTTILFTISTNAPDIDEIVTQLRQQARYTVGCLSAPFTGGMRNQTVCSVAYFNAQDCIPFRSEILGRPSSNRIEGWSYTAESTSPPSDDPQEDLFWTDTFEEAPELPNELLNYRELGSVVFFSDDSPHGLTRGLRSLRPTVNHLGLIASSTPFVTGLPYTLLYGDEIYSSGAIGLAFKRTMPLPSVTYNGIIPFSEEMGFTKCIGNLIYEIDEDNPVQKLERAIRSVGRAPGREDTYLIAAYNEENRSHMTNVYRITAGSPSRGSLSLEGEYAPHNQFTKFCGLDPNAFSIALNNTALMNSHAGSVNFVCSLDTDLSRSTQEKETDCQVLENSFIAASENGFLRTEIIMGPVLTSKCSIPGTVGTWHFV